MRRRQTMKRLLFSVGVAMACVSVCSAPAKASGESAKAPPDGGTTSALPRCEVIPQADHQVAFQVEGIERTRWHFGPSYPRPFFYPFVGPSGATLTRMGHPGAPNHDHHRSIWFAHNSVQGVDFWSDNTAARIRQKHWYDYRDGDDETMMAVCLGWYDDKGKELMEQDVVAALIPLAGGEQMLELQLTFRPPGGSAKVPAKPVELGKTNFGLLAVRVAKGLSTHFGGGRITNSEGQEGEKAIFGKPAKWMDYSGQVAVGQGKDRRSVVEGITYFDHPSNPRYPTLWHVREDGWMGASFCMKEGYAIEPDKPLVLRYLLHAHGGRYDHARAQRVQKAFADRPGFELLKAPRQHRQYEVRRKQ